MYRLSSELDALEYPDGEAMAQRCNEDAELVRNQLVSLFILIGIMKSFCSYITIIQNTQIRSQKHPQSP